MLLYSRKRERQGPGECTTIENWCTDGIGAGEGHRFPKQHQSHTGNHRQHQARRLFPPAHPTHNTRLFTPTAVVVRLHRVHSLTPQPPRLLTPHHIQHLSTTPKPLTQKTKSNKHISPLETAPSDSLPHSLPRKTPPRWSLNHPNCSAPHHQSHQFRSCSTIQQHQQLITSTT